MDGSNLKVSIPDWLADQLGVQEGSRVRVDNDGRKFNITPIEASPTYTRRN
jgi:antitoxin component of MazEF toxin-antitoxin module